MAYTASVETAALVPFKEGEPYSRSFVQPSSESPLLVKRLDNAVEQGVVMPSDIVAFTDAHRYAFGTVRDEGEDFQPPKPWTPNSQ